jgi:hypothetical protein
MLDKAKNAWYKERSSIRKLAKEERDEVGN